MKKVNKLLICLFLAFVPTLTVVNVANAQFSPYYNGSVKQPWRPKMLTARSFYLIPANDPRQFAAMTYWFMEYNPRIYTAGGHQVLSVSLRACFLKGKESWIKASSYNDAWLIHHEQGHVDIAEIYTRKLAQALKKTRFTTSNYNAQVRNAFDQFLAACKTAQITYDNQSAHCRNRAGQLMWDKWIREQLASTPAVYVVNADIE